MIREGHPIPTSPFLERGSAYDSLRYTIARCLFAADKRVISQAKIWRLNFMAVSALNGRTVFQFLGID